MRILRRVVRPRSEKTKVFSGINVPVTPADSSAGDRCHKPNLVTSLGPERCAGPDDQVHPTVFPATCSVAQGAHATVCWATGYALSIYGTE